MIPIKENREMVSSGVDESIAFGISAKDSIHIMSILRDQLYADKIMAVLREIGANAQDANAAAGRKHVPIEVTLPTLADPTLRIRDRGPGLSLDDVRTVFSQYGASTKRDSNEAVGMLGIGSKSPFAYSDSFVVTSWHGGTRAIYNAVIDPTGAGQIDLLDVVSCDPSETGVEVKVAIKPADCNAFEQRARKLFIHFDPRPVINIELPDPAKSRPITGGLIHDGHTRVAGHWTAVMGCIPYEIDLSQLTSGTGGNTLVRAVHRIAGTLRFDIGELQVAASRESLKYGDATRALLIQRINDAISEYTRIMLSGIDSLSNWEKRLRVHAIADLGLPVPAQFKHLTRDQIDVDSLKKLGPPITIQLKNWKGRPVATSYIRVQAGARLIIMDERRAFSGYEISKDDLDYIVRLAAGSADPKRVGKQIADACKALQIDGIPIVLASSLKWVKPTSSRTPVARNAEKARSYSFVLDLAALARSTATPSSSMSHVWSVSDDGASDQDVFVVIEGYAVPEFSEFYNWVRADVARMNVLGLPLPRIVGYKNTKRHPVDRTKCVGTEYVKWRSSVLSKLMFAVPAVQRAVAAMSYTASSNGSAGPFAVLLGGALEIDRIRNELGSDHPLVLFSMAVERGRMCLDGCSAAIKQAAEFVWSTRKLSGIACGGAEDLRGLIRRYPLLGVAPVGAFTSGNWKLWVDYVKLVDSVNVTEGKQEEAA